MEIHNYLSKYLALAAIFALTTEIVFSSESDIQPSKANTLSEIHSFIDDELHPIMVSVASQPTKELPGKISSTSASSALRSTKSLIQTVVTQAAYAAEAGDKSCDFFFMGLELSSIEEYLSQILFCIESSSQCDFNEIQGTRNSLFRSYFELQDTLYECPR